MTKVPKKKPIILRVEVPVLFTKEEERFLVLLSRRNHLTVSEMVTSVMRRHLKSRYQIPRKEWYYVFGK